jgi:hypothetical protein
MSTRPLLCISLVLMTLASACGPARLEPSGPQPLPSPTQSWTLSLTQSGGLAGVSLKVTVSSDGQLTAEDQRTGRIVTQRLSPDVLARLAALYSSDLQVVRQPAPSACADCFTYDLEASSGGTVKRIHADDTTLDASGAAELIRMLQRLRDDALKSQP